MEFKPTYEGYKTRVSESFNRQSFMSHIGAFLSDIQPGYCEIHLPYNDRLTQQHGYFHAGVISTIADNAGGYAGFSLMDEHASVLTVEFKLNILNPGDGDLLKAKARVLKKGRTLIVCRSDVYVVKSGIEKICAAAQLTLIELKNTKDTGA